MSALTAAAIGGVAGFSIFLGLPVARLRGLSTSVQGFLNALALGILVFLLWDILSHATAPVQAALAGVRAGHPGQFIALAVVFVAGLAAGLLVLTYGNQRLVGRVKATGQASPRGLSMAIATGLGFHNLSEGLAIGQSAADGAIAFAGVLVIGFALHNITEGFGIAAPMTMAGTRPSWAFLGLAGLIGGGPTVVGTMIGLFATSVTLSVLFLALAAGALIYVINEMFGVAKRLNSPPSLGWGLLTGFLVAYATDLLLTYLTY
ncbi:MAG TPA: ZIP family metal transporter [Candidatus Dormibacteraeota bacterium]|nr:ZIP family metal transporter [Candidatus Dormibacteraeota bacterium]